MRKRSLAALFAGALLLTACQGAVPPPASSPDTALARSASETAQPASTALLQADPTAATYEYTHRVAQAATLEAPAFDSQARYDQRVDNPVDPAVIERINAFAAESASRVLDSSDENGCYSPMSLYYALAIAAMGARGDTQAEMLGAMNLTLQDRKPQSLTDAAQGLADGLGALYRHDYADNKVGKLKIANSVWTHSGLPFHDAYLQEASQKLYASLFNADFGDPATAREMSAWVKENTGGLIEPKIEISPDHAMAIFNTLHFKDEWMRRFNVEETKAGDFTRADGKTVQALYMTRVENTGYATGDGYTSVRLALKDSGSMTFILPDAGRDVRDLFKTPERAAEVFSVQHDKMAEVTLKVPKFSYDRSFTLESALKDMGIALAFGQGADFTGMSDMPLWIDYIKQDTHITIDENGVEAAAFTQVMMTAGGMRQPAEKLAFSLTRPFGYYITTRGGTVLFMGVVNDPAQG